MKANLSSSIAREYGQNIKKVYAFRFFKGLHFFSAVLVPFFTVWGQISFTEIMFLQAIFTFSIFLLEVPTGVVADYFGRKVSLVAGAIFGVVAPLVYVTYPSFWIFALAEFLWAITAALISGADSAIVYDSLKLGGQEKQSKKVFTRIGSIGLLGILVATPLGGLIAEVFGVQATMLFTAVPMLITVFIALTFKEPSVHFEENEASLGYFETFKEGFNYLRRHKKLRTLVADYVPVAVLSFFMIWVYQVVLADRGVAIGYFGFVHAGIVVAEILLLHYFEKVESFFGGKKNYLNVTAYLIGALFIVMAVVSNLVVTLSCIFVIGAFGMTRKEVYKSYFNKFIESKIRATVLSTVSMIYSLTMAVSNIVFGRLVDLNLTWGLICVGFAVILFNFLSKLDDEHLMD